VNKALAQLSTSSLVYVLGTSDTLKTIQKGADFRVSFHLSGFTIEWDH
jgi:hypothetical protein